MANYQNVLLATDFSDDSETLGHAARNLADKYSAMIHVVHVVDSLPITDAGYGPIMPLEIDFTEQLVQAAETRLKAFAEHFQVPRENCHVEVGSPKLEIVRLAEALNCDLIIVGSHGRHGLSALLGSTASGVLHHAQCDVLAVRTSRS